MTDRDFFTTERGTLRTPWRLAFFFLALVGCGLAAGVVLGPVLQSLHASVGLRSVTIAGWVQVAAALGAHWLLLRRVDDLPWRHAGLDRASAAPARLAFGFLVGAAAIVIPMMLLVALGWLDRVPGSDGSWAAAMVRISLFLLPAALFEELMMRGYLYSVIREIWGWRWAIVATSLAFAALHIRNAGASPASLALVALAGIWLGLLREKTGSLYAAWMAHFAWNWCMAALFHTPVSGYPFEAPEYRYVDAGPDWATGGEWGPEAGLPAGLGMLVAAGYLYVRILRPNGNQER